MTRAVVIGYGSIGQRHTRVLRQLGVDVAVVSRRDIDTSPRFSGIADAIRDHAPSHVVIASRTNEHMADIAALAAAGHTGVVLVEKPLFDSDVPFPANDFSDVYVAYNLRLHPCILRLRALLADRKIFAVEAYVGQYLPDWRPGTDYRQSYSAHKELGGGVIRDLSHELDLVLWLFGPWTRLTALGGTVGDLGIGSDDCYSLLLETRHCPSVSVQMNYLDRMPTRRMRVLTDNGTYIVDLMRGTVTGPEGEERLAAALNRDHTYVAQHEALLDTTPETPFLCTLEQGLAVNGTIAAAEIASSEGIWVRNDRPTEGGLS